MPLKSTAQPPQEATSHARTRVLALVTLLAPRALRLLHSPVSGAAASHMPHVMVLFAADHGVHFLVEGEDGEFGVQVHVACATAAGGGLGGGGGGGGVGGGAVVGGDFA